jgi:hypothetical protein
MAGNRSFFPKVFPHFYTHFVTFASSELLKNRFHPLGQSCGSGFIESGSGYGSRSSISSESGYGSRVLMTKNLIKKYR